MFPSLVVGRSRSPDSQIDAPLRLPGQTGVWVIQWLIATSLPGHSGEDRAGLTPASLGCAAELSSRFADVTAKYQRAAPYAGDALALPVGSVDAAVPFYEGVMGFRLVERREAPHKAAILARDSVRIGLAENGGDPTQEGCFFEVDDVEAAFAELQANGLGRDDADFRVDEYGETSYRVFFVVAPDGLCYCLGQRQGP